ncbi:alpha/beta fold hydrolase [Nocardioides dubius]|uniref:Alpha/beta hydrolase n=1 Tax=Nocardioides dubius TaxID=317019 RepID=A0ABP4EKV0_9ACTN
MTSVSLTRRNVAGQRALILMLHGGQEISREPVEHSSGPWRRSLVMQHAITRRAHAAGVGTWLLRYRERGWNDDAAPSPVPDARWALDQVRRELGEVPVVLVGHSMGARTSVHVADDPLVQGVVALAPWLPPEDPVTPLIGKSLAAAHGSTDQITSAKATARFVERARAHGASAEFHDMGPVGHYMLRRVRAWNEFAISRSLALLPR